MTLLLAGRWKGNQPNWLFELELLDALAEVVAVVAAVSATIVAVAAAAEPETAAARVALG
jgi:hypothetical protein